MDKYLTDLISIVLLRPHELRISLTYSTLYRMNRQVSNYIWLALSSNVCLILLGQLQIGQNWYGMLSTWWNSQISQQKIVADLMGHPVSDPCLSMLLSTEVEFSIKSLL